MCVFGCVFVCKCMRSLLKWLHCKQHDVFRMSLNAGSWVEIWATCFIAFHSVNTIQVCAILYSSASLWLVYSASSKAFQLLCVAIFFLQPFSLNSVRFSLRLQTALHFCCLIHQDMASVCIIWPITEQMKCSSVMLTRWWDKGTTSIINFMWIVSIRSASLSSHSTHSIRVLVWLCEYEFVRVN